jgi:hypothetical protein
MGASTPRCPGGEQVWRHSSVTVRRGVCLTQQRSHKHEREGMTDDAQAPWGGFKFSGIGREYGRYGIEAFLETRAILEA